MTRKKTLTGGRKRRSKEAPAGYKISRDGHNYVSILDEDRSSSKRQCVDGGGLVITGKDFETLSAGEYGKKIGSIMKAVLKEKGEMRNAMKSLLEEIGWKEPLVDCGNAAAKAPVLVTPKKPIGREELIRFDKNIFYCSKDDPQMSPERKLKRILHMLYVTYRHLLTTLSLLLQTLKETQSHGHQLVD